MSNITAYGRLKLIKFENSDFDLSTSPADTVTIRKLNMDSDVDAIMFKSTRPVSEKNTALGTKIPFSTPGGESMMQFNFYEDEDRAIYNFLYLLASPDARLINGKIEHFNQPGVDYTDFKAQCRAEFTPVSVDEISDQTKLILIERAIIVIEEGLKLGQPNSIVVMVKGIGGAKKTLLAGTVDISAGIDLSAGAVDKLIKMEINGVEKTVNFGQSAATSSVAILAFINAAFTPDTPASEVATFLQLDSATFGAPIIVDDPDTGVSGLTELFGFTSRTFEKGVVPVMTR